MMTPEQRNLRLLVADWAERGRARAVTYNQDTWISADRHDPVPVEQMREGQCRSSGCIAGMTAIMTAPAGTTIIGDLLDVPGAGMISVDRFGQEQLGLDEEQADLVFMAEAWETPFLLRYLAEHPGASQEELRTAVVRANIPVPRKYRDEFMAI